jgi:L-aspartate oxidase
LHGANRLASNSLLEGLVYGAHAGDGASQQAAQSVDDFRALPLENPRAEDSAEPLDLADIRNSLKSLMWRAAGVRRSGDQLAEAEEDVDRWCGYVLPRQFQEPGGWELQNMLTVSRLMISAAHTRQETRGVHVRTDFPTTDNAGWRRHLTFRRTG